ncbi:AdoMet-homocysteine methyltransferase [Didymosphaeria variabile]|uniref:AdoMet-homocysteine methyltransferase n=1 Tax=Didymosphaeria variabile TaxID=1932322 RepID=A0A9W9C7W4_9PLEO|nr:AdoMet-homocysteine methyltransferase [Didymosphaeria variabile]KAJ4348330.1 AdoMet-homocysteine methyltransferase [Didymosphaeria variabile]
MDEGTATGFGVRGVEDKAVKLSTLLAEGKGVVLDGALATYLETLGADISSALWSASLLRTNPSLIQQTHATYFSHASQIATTSSYQASLPGLIEHLSITESEAVELVRESVLLAQRARDDYLSSTKLHVEHAHGAKDRLLVAGSVGPYGAYLADGSEYTGSYTLTSSQYQYFHRGRIAALVDAGVHVLAIETIPNFVETRALLDLLQTEFPHIEAWFAFTLQPSDATRIADGTPVADVVALLQGYDNAVAVGVNCVAPELALAGLREMRKGTGKPLIVYANSGEKWDAKKRDWKGGKPGGGELAVWVRDAWDAGARIIGGCCRTGPEDMANVAQTLGELSRFG